MKIKKTIIIDINLDAERKRVHSCKFNKGEKSRLLKLISIFESGDFKAACKYVSTMPYCKRGEYPEAEHVSIAMMNFLQDWAYNFDTATFEILPDRDTTSGVQ